MRVPSSIDRTKASMGYQSSGARPHCRSCYFSEQVRPTGAYNDMWPWRCKKGNFGVTPQSVCNEHQPVRQEGGAV